MKNQKKKTWPKVLLLILCIFFSVFAFIFAVFYFKLSKIKTPEPKNSVLTEAEYSEKNESELRASAQDKDKAVWPEPAAPIHKEGVLNILLLGNELNEDTAHRSTESILIISYDAADGEIKIVPILSGLYVGIPGYGDNFLNASYEIGGFELLIDTIGKNFGIGIDGCLEADISDSVKIIDMVGGIDITLSSKEAKALGLEAGRKHFNSALTLEYLRIKEGVTEIAKAQCQRRIITQLLIGISKVGTAEKLKIFDSILPYLTTDMSKNEMIGFFLTVLKYGVTRIDPVEYSIPLEGTYRNTNIKGSKVLLPDLNSNRSFLKKWLYKIES